MERGYLLRIIFDSDREDVYKDVLFRSTDLFNQVQDVLIQRFGLDVGKTCVFALANDDWETFEQFDPMKHRLCDAIFRKGDRLVFKYGEYDSWNFLIELLSLHELESDMILPIIVEEYGMLPDQQDSEDYDPDNFLIQNSRTGYKEKPEEKPEEEDEGEDDTSNDKDIWEFF